jgi:hypothetical protein
MKNLSKFVLGFVLTTACALGLLSFAQSCAALRGATASEVLVDPQYVPEGTLVIETPMPVKTPDGEDTGRSFVIVHEDSLAADTPRLPLSNAPRTPMEDAGLTGTLGGLLWGTPVGPFVPLIGYVATKLLAARRPRQHATAAIKALAKGNVGEAVMRLAKAEGVKHSTPASEKTAEATDPAMHAKSAT